MKVYAINPETGTPSIPYYIAEGDLRSKDTIAEHITDLICIIITTDEAQFPIVHKTEEIWNVICESTPIYLINYVAEKLTEEDCDWYVEMMADALEQDEDHRADWVQEKVEERFCPDMAEGLIGRIKTHLKVYTIAQFKKAFKLKKQPDIKFSQEPGWAYMGFFKHEGIIYKMNTYGPPGYVEAADEIPKDIIL